MDPDYHTVPLTPWDDDADRAACGRPLVMDPLAWSLAGDWTPYSTSVRAGEGRRFRAFHGSAQDRRRWVCVCRGRSGAAAKSAAIYLDPGGGGRWDGSGLRVADAVEWGRVDYGRSRTRSARWWGVVLEIADDRLVIADMPSLAVAVARANAHRGEALGNTGKVRRRRELHEARLWVAAHPVPAEDEEALAALG